MMLLRLVAILRSESNFSLVSCWSSAGTSDMLFSGYDSVNASVFCPVRVDHLMRILTVVRDGFHGDARLGRGDKGTDAFYRSQCAHCRAYAVHAEIRYCRVHSYMHHQCLLLSLRPVFKNLTDS
jgi:hypothetical protein